MLAQNYVKHIVLSHKQQCGFLKTCRAPHWDAIYIHMANVVFITSTHVHGMIE